MARTSIFAAMLLAVMLASSTLGETVRRLDAASYMAALSANEPMCEIENGFDFVGNDIANVPGHYTQCCSLCASVADCGAWTWTDYNGGTCWLKWARGKYVVNANAKSALMFPWARPTCDSVDGIDIVGDDFARVKSETAYGCCDLCKNYLGCRAYTWSDYNGGSCWLKREVRDVVSKPGVKSARVYPDFTVGCSFPFVDGDSVGNDIANKPGSRVEDCCGVCRATRGCRAYSWSNYNGGTCWLKSRSGNFTTKPGVSFSQLYPDPNPPFCVIETDVDYADNDIANVPGKDAEECCNKCRGYNGCKAWSWSTFNNGTCWLKSQQGAKALKAGVLSGVV